MSMIDTPGGSPQKVTWDTKPFLASDQYGAVYKIEPAWASADGFLHLHFLDGQSGKVYQADLALDHAQVKQLISTLGKALEAKTGEKTVVTPKVEP